MLLAPPCASNPGRGRTAERRSAGVMAAEKTPSRRKQCIFHRTFLRLPFGRCERRSRSSSGSSYDVRLVEATQPTAEKWSPRNSSMADLGLHQPHPGENMDSDVAIRTHPSFAEPVNRLNGAQGEHVVLDPVLMIGHQSNMAFAPPNPDDHEHMDSLEVSVEDSGQRDVDSAYSSVSQIEEESPHLMVSPPSPSVSSMEMDTGVDPETGERAIA